MAQLKNTTINGTLQATTATASTSLTLNGTDLKTKLALADTLYSRLEKLFGTYYELSTTYTAGSNYTVNSVSAYLCGNTIRCYFDATRKSAASGNIGNETVVKFTINSGNRVSGFWSVAFPNAGQGGNASFYVTGTSLSNGVLTFSVNASAYAQSTTRTTSLFLIPVKLNMSAY